MKTMDDRRAQFDAECRSAGLTLGARDYDLLYDMWLDWLPERDPAGDAFITRRLRDAGAVLLGKLAMHEWAFGRPVTDGPFPTGRNPWDVRRAPAGSSSGSAVAAAAGLCAGALGSDTGGSIRGPPAVCGLVGPKPTYGPVSRRRVPALSRALDHGGPMDRGAGDSAG